LVSGPRVGREIASPGVIEVSDEGGHPGVWQSPRRRPWARRRGDQL